MIVISTWLFRIRSLFSSLKIVKLCDDFESDEELIKMIVYCDSMKRLKADPT